MQPRNGAEWIVLGERHLARGETVRAATCYEWAARLEPGVAAHWARLGKVHLAQRKYDAAEAELSRACMLEPKGGYWQVLLAHALREQNQAEAALDACHRALRCNPEDVHAAVAEALMLPPIYSSCHELRVWRERFASGVERLHSGVRRWLRHPRRILDLEWHNFLLAYQGENDLELQTRYSSFVAALLASAADELRNSPVRERGAGDRIRIGFVSSEFRHCTVGHYFLHWVTDLPRDRFHVTTLHAGHFVDEQTGEFERGSDDFARLTGRPDAMATAIRQRNFDVVVLPDVGMSANSVLLSNVRLAPVQCAAWGHPVTTGSRFVDYFITCAEMEPRNAQSHYGEKLIALPGIGVRYRMPAVPPPGERSQFGLPESSRIYVCPHALQKIHPEMDDLLVDIVTRDESAVLLFFAAPAPGQTRAFLSRIERALREHGVVRRQQIKLLPQMTRDNFLRAMSLCDVMIDTVHWSGGSTTLDALACALPVVTLEGRFMRGRQTAAMLRLIDLEESIALDRESYVSLALRLARDAGYRAAVSERIRRGWAKLFDRSEPVAALANALEQAVLQRFEA